MRNRIELAEYFNELGFKYGAEIGVLEGRYSEILCQKIPGLKLLCIDDWKLRITHPKMKRAKALLAPYDATCIRKTSMDAVKDVQDESLDFVFIDAGHHPDLVREDIREWTKKVRKGGIVSGHDYYEHTHIDNDVMGPVNEYIKETGYQLQIIDWDKENPVRDDRQPCWFFIK